MCHPFILNMQFHSDPYFRLKPVSYCRHLRNNETVQYFFLQIIDLRKSNCKLKEKKSFAENLKLVFKKGYFESK